jgi:hypothetical protein
MKIPDWLKNFMNTEYEKHAFIVGLCESLHYKRCSLNVKAEATGYIDKEYHYYMFGRACGFIALLFILLGLAKLAVTIF